MALLSAVTHAAIREQFGGPDPGGWTERDGIRRAESFTGPVRQLAHHGGTQTLWVVAADGAVSARAAPSGDLICDVPVRARATAVAVFSGHVVVGYADGTLELYNPSGVLSGDSAHELSRVKGHCGAVACMCVAGGRLWTGGADWQRVVWTLRPAGEGKSLAFVDRIPGHQGAVRCMHHEAGRVYSGSDDHTIRVALTPSCAEPSGTRFPVSAHRGSVNAVVCYGPSLFSAGSDCAVREWCSATGAATRTVLRADAAVTCLLKDRVCGRLWCGGVDGAVRVWDPRTGEVSCRLDAHRGSIVTGMAPAERVTRTMVVTCGGSSIVSARSACGEREQALAAELRSLTKDVLRGAAQSAAADRRARAGREQLLRSLRVFLDAKPVYRRYMSKLQRWAVLARTRGARTSVAAALLQGTTRGRLLLRFRVLRAHAVYKARVRLQRRFAETMLLGSARATRLMYWQRLCLQVRLSRIRRRGVGVQSVVGTWLGSVDEGCMRRQFYRRWVAWVSRAKQQQRLSRILACMGPRGLKQHYYRALVRFHDRERQQAAKQAVSRHLASTLSGALRYAAWARLLRYSRVAARRRACPAAELLFGSTAASLRRRFYSKWCGGRRSRNPREAELASVRDEVARLEARRESDEDGYPATELRRVEEEMARMRVRIEEEMAEREELAGEAVKLRGLATAREVLITEPRTSELLDTDLPVWTRFALIYRHLKRCMSCSLVLCVDRTTSVEGAVTRTWEAVARGRCSLEDVWTGVLSPRAAVPWTSVIQTVVAIDSLLIDFSSTLRTAEEVGSELRKSVPETVAVAVAANARFYFEIAARMGGPGFVCDQLSEPMRSESRKRVTKTTLTGTDDRDARPNIMFTGDLAVQMLAT